jgi:CspA family cold shock protein
MQDVKGIVKWFDPQKGFGFLTAENDTDVFVHYSAIVRIADEFRTLREGDPVEFQVEKGDKGLYAANVRPVADEVVL